MAKADQISEQYADKTGEWTKVLNDFKKTYTVEISDEENYSLTKQTADLLIQFLNIFIEHGQFKDTWEEQDLFVNINTIETRIRSVKTGSLFDLGYDHKGLYLQIRIGDSGSLKNMDDSFWSIFLQMQECGIFSFIENETFGSEVRKELPHLFRNPRGNLFMVLRNYFISEIKFKEDYSQRQFKDNIDLGWLQVSWPASEYSVHDILNQGTKAFKLMYKLNYLLWKRGILAAKGK